MPSSAGRATKASCARPDAETEQHWLVQVKAVDRSALPEKLRHNLPDWLAEALQRELGEQFWPFVEAMSEAPLDLRVNTLKAKREGRESRLAAAGIEAEPTPYFAARPAHGGQAGAAQSSRCSRAARSRCRTRAASCSRCSRRKARRDGGGLSAPAPAARRWRWARRCATPAGSMRSTPPAIAWRRAEAAAARAAAVNVYPVQIAHESATSASSARRQDRPRAGRRALLGLGTLRRNPDLKWRQTPQAIAELRAKQTAILASAARWVKPGGRLVYATCSLLREENEAIAGLRRGARRMPSARCRWRSCWPPRMWAVALNWCARGLRLWPHRHGNRRIFAAAWQRPDLRLKRRHLRRTCQTGST